MPKMMKTGIEGLDRVLCGGLLHHNSVLVKGAPGCGKTTLGIQTVYNGAVMFDEPGVIVLFEQFPQQLYRDLMSYDWDIEKLVRENKLRVIFSSPDQVVAPDKMRESPLVSQIHDAAMEIGAIRILIDSITHILNLASDTRHAREMLLRFINALKSIGLTPIMTAEAENRLGAIGIDEYLCDCVLLLSSEASKDKTFHVRELTIRKTRGHDHLRGRHLFKLSRAGIEVFPLTQAHVSEDIAGERAAGKLEKLSSGISGLDDLLGGGYPRGTSTIITGMPGTFKTTLAAQFAVKGAEPGDKSLIISFTEHPEFFAALMEEKGLRVRAMAREGRLKVWHFTPKESYIEELLYRLEAEMDGNGITRLVVDGINEIERSIEAPEAYKDVISTFLSACASRGVTSLFTQKMDQFTGHSPLTDIRYASMFDGIVYLGTIEIESSVHKVVSVLKMRGSNYSNDLREIVCDNTGIKVLSKFIGLSGVLSGNAQGQYKKNIEELFQPLYFIRDFLEILSTTEMAPDERDAVVQNLRGETNKLVDKLKIHFDVKS
ncbi:MAG: ATPase domain-containing protein [bacterium]|nr:hypothetical protein [Candidatus Sumerlaeota bacterium]